MRTVLMCHPVTREGLLINPTGMYEDVVRQVKVLDMQVKAIILTSGLFYQSMDLKENWLRVGKPPIYVGKEDKELFSRYYEQPNMFHEKFQKVDLFGFDKYPPVTHYMSDGDPLPALNGKAIHFPGISEGSYALYFPDHKFLFAGEGIAKGFFGPCDLPVSNASQFRESIKTKILTLPSDTRIWGSTGDLSTVLIERRFNPMKPAKKLTEKEKRRQEQEESAEDTRLLFREYKSEAEKEWYERGMIEEFEDHQSGRATVRGFDFKNRPSKHELKRRERARRWKEFGHYPERFSKKEQEDPTLPDEAYADLSDSTEEPRKGLDPDEEIGEWVRVKQKDLGNVDLTKYVPPGNRLKGIPVRDADDLVSSSDDDKNSFPNPERNSDNDYEQGW